MKIGRFNSSVLRRAILIITALGSLCVSDTAGPRLLPLPTPEASAQSTSASSVDFVSPSPNRDDEPGEHMAMTAGVQYRQRDRHQHTQTAAHSVQQLLELPVTESLQFHLLHSIPKSKPAFLSIHTGRAPPHSI